MVSTGVLLSGLTVALSLKDRQDTKELREQLANGGDVPDDQKSPDLQVQESIRDELEALRKTTEKNEPSPGDKDAYSSATFEMAPGETVVVTVEPQDGQNLRVKEVYLDRKTDHDYTINVGGEVSSVSHRAKYVSPKKISQSDKVMAEVTNNSNNTTVIDFELEAWAEVA